MSKTVYILGAGFSRCAGAPSQERILREIFSLERRDGFDFYWGEFERHRSELETFVQEIFEPVNVDARGEISLEDLFTFIDKAILERADFNSRPEEDLRKIRAALEFSIIYMFDQKLRNRPQFYDDLANVFVNKRVKAGQSADPFGFISLNWDIVLDNAIGEVCQSFSGDNRNRKVGIDYCCYATDRSTGLGSMMWKPSGGFNIKIQKLHGSFNWLICRRCGRLIYEVGRKATLLTFINKTPCDYCRSTSSLGSLFVTPTLLKDLNNTHLRMVWHNAGLDLMEAERVVFVGYSLPLADFELRYLLKKSIRRDTRIEVVLKQSAADYEKVRKNYDTFFGRRLPNEQVHKNGAEKFFAHESDFDFVEQMHCKKGT
jgi:NAD-dependent SIR2 family protein deacetylase